MIGYIHLAASGEKQKPPFLLDIKNVASVSYNAVLFPSRVDVLEEEAYNHNPFRWRNRHGNLGALRVLPDTVPRLLRSDFNAVNAQDMDLDGFAHNRTDFGGYFKHRNITITLSPEVNLQPMEMIPLCQKVPEPVCVRVMKYSETRKAYQQIDIETKSPRLQFSASLSESKDELDFQYWHDQLAANKLDYVISEQTAEIDPALYNHRLFGHIENDIIEDEIIKTFCPVRLLPIVEPRHYEPPDELPSN